MELLLEIHQELMSTFGPGIYILLGFVAVIGVIGQWMLYYKCDLPGMACVVPVWNVIVFLKIVGRPAWQSLIVMIPPPVILGAMYLFPDPTIKYGVMGVFGIIWTAYMIKVYIEICNRFGKTRPVDYMLCIIFNGFYVLYLGLGEAEYQGPEIENNSPTKIGIAQGV
jgi:hypothetical protein